MTLKNLRTQEEIISAWASDLSEPAVSICCITYNHEKYIEDALEGFLIQETDFPIEILIHDDASTDKTADIIREYERKYPKLIKPIYQSENQYSLGRKINQKFNFPRAKGDYIALCEGDDFWLDPHKLKIQKRFLDNNHEYVICYADIRTIDVNTANHARDYGGARKDLSSQELQRSPSIFTLTTMFRNLITSNPPELAISRYGDLTLWSRLGEYGKGKFLAEIKPSIYRIHEGGIHSMQPREKQFQMRLETMMALHAYWQKRDNPELANYFLDEVVLISLSIRKFKLIKKMFYWFRKIAFLKLKKRLGR